MTVKQCPAKMDTISNGRNGVFKICRYSKAYQPLILDATSSFRRMWKNKQHPWTVYMDVRSNRQIQKDWKECMIQKGRNTDAGFTKLTIQADFSHLPFKSNTFKHISFDPPHLIHLGKTSIYYKQYGALEADTWRLVLKKAAKELIRVLDYGGTLNVKWSDRDIPSEEVLKLFPIEPLYGQEGAHGASSKTNWFTFVKLPILAEEAQSKPLEACIQ